jgi:hypothetical protein
MGTESYFFDLREAADCDGPGATSCFAQRARPATRRSKLATRVESPAAYRLIAEQRARRVIAGREALHAHEPDHRRKLIGCTSDAGYRLIVTQAELSIAVIAPTRD